MAEKREILTTTEARGGVGTHVVRYVLIVSLLLAVAAMVWTFVLAPRATQQEINTMRQVGGKMMSGNTQ